MHCSAFRFLYHSLPCSVQQSKVHHFAPCLSATTSARGFDLKCAWWSLCDRAYLGRPRVLEFLTCWLVFVCSPMVFGWFLVGFRVCISVGVGLCTNSRSWPCSATEFEWEAACTNFGAQTAQDGPRSAQDGCRRLPVGCFCV